MNKKILSAVIAAAMIMSVSGCASENTNSGMGGMKNAEAADKVTDDEAVILVTGDDYPLTVRDYLKYETVIETKPERAAVLSGTPLNIWYDLGGNSICTSDVSNNIRLTEGYEDEIRALPQIFTAR